MPAVDFRAVARTVVGLLPAHGTVLVNNPRSLPSSVYERAEAVGQLGVLQRHLSVLGVDVEHSALGAGAAAGLKVEDSGLDPVDVQNAREGEASESGSDDEDGVVGGHGELLLLFRMSGRSDACPGFPCRTSGRSEGDQVYVRRFDEPHDLAAIGSRCRPPAFARRGVEAEDTENSSRGVGFSSIANTFVTNKFADAE